MTRLYPRVSIIMCAYNEEQSIDSTLRSVSRELRDRDDCEIIVVTDGCTDRTEEVIQKYANALILRNGCRQGKPRSLVRAVSAAKGKILIVTDADVIWNKGVVGNLLAPFEDERVGLVCGRIEDAGRPNTLLGALARTRCVMWDRVRRQMAASGLLSSPSGQLYAVRRNLFPEVPASITADDLYVGIAVANNMAHAVYEPAAIARSLFPSTFRDLFKQRMRNHAGRFQLELVDPVTVRTVRRHLLHESVRLVTHADEAGRLLAVAHLVIDLCAQVAGFCKHVAGKNVVLWEPVLSTKRVSLLGT